MNIHSHTIYRSCNLYPNTTPLWAILSHYSIPIFTKTDISVIHYTTMKISLATIMIPCSSTQNKVSAKSFKLTCLVHVNDLEINKLLKVAAVNKPINVITFQILG